MFQVSERICGCSNKAHGAFVFCWHLVGVHIVVTRPILTFGAIPHVAAFPLANGAWLDIQQHAYLGRGLAGFKEFPWLVRKWPVGPETQALISKDY